MITLTIRQLIKTTYWVVLTFILLVIGYEAPSAFLPTLWVGGIAGMVFPFHPNHW
jgi:hypothetical protein